MAVEHFNDLADGEDKRSQAAAQKLGRLYVERMQTLMLRPDIIKAMQSVAIRKYE